MSKTLTAGTAGRVCSAFDPGLYSLRHPWSRNSAASASSSTPKWLRREPPADAEEGEDARWEKNDSE